MRQFVEQRRVELFGGIERVARWHPYGVSRRPVPRATVLLHRGWIWHLANDAVAFLDWIDHTLRVWRSNSLALLYVEHCVVAQQDGRFLISLAVRILYVTRANFPEDNFSPVFALADVSTTFGGLLVGQPVRRTVPGRGKQEHVNPAISASACE